MSDLDFPPVTPMAAAGNARTIARLEELGYRITPARPGMDAEFVVSWES